VKPRSPNDKDSKEGLHSGVLQRVGKPGSQYTLLPHEVRSLMVDGTDFKSKIQDSKNKFPGMLHFHALIKVMENGFIKAITIVGAQGGNVWSC